MRGCEPCQGRKAAAISIVSCVPWEFSAPSILRLRHTASVKTGAFFLLFLGNKKGRQSDETEIDRPSIKGKALYEFAVKMLNRAHQIFCSDEAK